MNRVSLPKQKSATAYRAKVNCKEKHKIICPIPYHSPCIDQKSHFVAAFLRPCASLNGAFAPLAGYVSFRSMLGYLDLEIYEQKD